MCVGNSGVTKYNWADAQPGDVIPVDDITGIQFMSLGVPSQKEAPLKFDCAHCGSVNRWMAGDRPPTKCRHCGAPEKA